MEEILSMSVKERQKLKILARVKEGCLSQVAAGKILGISDRQIRNLLRQLKEQGDKGIISRKRGCPSNRSLNKEVREKAITLIRRNYVDFGPTFANEYLKKHGISISKETLRLWMIKEHLWIPKTKKQKRHPPRARRRFFGELVQIDGSHHDWFEGRREACVLMVMIDDATGILTSLYFAESESLEAYYKTLEKHITGYGIPLGIYGDHCAVLTPRNPKKEQHATQFRKALEELNCQLILAASPQAKGRVERANRTLQDRLVKEMRLQGISTLEAANAFLEEYRKKHNELFSKQPVERKDAHRPLEGICLERVLCIRETRTLTKDLVIQFQNTFYQVSPQDENTHLHKGGKVEIRRKLDGKTIALFEGKEVQMKALSEVGSPILDEKELMRWTPRKLYIPPSTHPYKRRYFHQQEKMLRKVV